MKKKFCLLLILCILLSLVVFPQIFGGAILLFLVATGDDSADKADVIAFVCENEEALLLDIEKGDFSAYKNTEFIKNINAEETVVDFSCGGAGIGSGTSYVGFYYSSENNMTAVWCAPSSEDSLTPSEEGYAWQESNGDNYYYTEHICGNFYYYEASF